MGPDNAGVFLFAMRCVFVLFAGMSFFAASIGFRALRREIHSEA